MAVLVYCLVLVAVAVAVLAMGHVWMQGMAHALGDRSRAARGRKLFWVGVMLLFGWPGAVTYWLLATPRSA